MIDQIQIRPWNKSDLGSLVRYANNLNIAKNLRDRFPYPYKEQDGIAFIESAMEGMPTSIFAIDLHGEAIGCIGIHPQLDIHRLNAELAYWLAEPFWGKGIITRAISLMLDMAFAGFEIQRIYAIPFSTNHSSKRVLEKNNFVLEAKFEKTIIKNGEILDELVYAIRKENWKKSD